MSDDKRIPYVNAEGYPDPTAYKALNAVQDELEAKWDAERRVLQIVKAVRLIAELGGFELAGRIVLIDKATGETYK